MCGIAGIVKFDPTERVEEQRLLRMRDVLAHRGPDGKGLRIDGPVGIAHRRLAIVDVAAGQQPMSNENGSVWVVFNGEIYNHPTLRAELEQRGHRYRTRSDTETILHLYEETGTAVVEQLHGMFAFALWDRGKSSLLLARDRVGIKPLYYACTDSELRFASEIKSLLADGSIRPAFNEAILPEFLATGFVSSDETFFRGIRKLLPGHVLTWSAPDGVRVREYWKLPGGDDADGREAPSLNAAALELRTRLEASVRSHLMSDVPLGVFLSGGLDSSALAALVSRATGEKVRTFAVGFAERGANELEFARLAANSIDADHHEIVVTPEQYFDSLPKLVWHEDEPIAFPSSVPLYFVSALAREHVKVVLTGEGADELFLGYNRYRVSFWNTRVGRPYWALVPQAVQQRIRDAVLFVPGMAGRYARRAFFGLQPGIRSVLFENFAVFPETVRRRVLAPGLEVDGRDPHAVQMLRYEESGGDMLARMSSVDMQTYLRELLMKQDQMSMAASIESRVPFLDDALVEHVAQLPSALKLRGWRTKAVLRAAIRDLVPPAILSRPKMGFPVPVGRWLRDRFRPIVDEFVLGPRAQARGLFDAAPLRSLVEDHRAGGRHGDRLWLLVNLEIWHRLFCEGESPADIVHSVAAHAARTSYANSLGQDGRPLARDERRPRPQPANHLGALAAASGDGGHDARP